LNCVRLFALLSGAPPEGRARVAGAGPSAVSRLAGYVILYDTRMVTTALCAGASFLVPLKTSL